MALRVTLIQGGGAGFDQVPAVQRILKAAGVDIDWDEHLAGLPSLERGGEALPEELLQSVRRTGLALKTKLLSPTGQSERALTSGAGPLCFRAAPQEFARITGTISGGRFSGHPGVDGGPV